MNKKNVLLIDKRYPYKTRDSGSIDTINYINALVSIGYNVFFCAAAGDKEKFGTFEKSDTNFHEIPSDYLFEWLSTNGVHIDIVIYFRFEVINSLKENVSFFCKKAKTIFFTCDISFLREERQAYLENDNIKKIKSIEKRSLELNQMRQSDAAIVVSEYELLLIRKIDENIPVHYIPLAREMVSVNETKGELNLGFIGGFEHAPNVDAVMYFSNTIWPVIHRKFPSAKFYIAGSKPPREIQNLNSNNIIVMGYIEQEKELFEKIIISIAPLRFGAGQKGKVLSSLCHSVPVIGSPVALEGMGIETGTCAFEAKTEQDWINKISDIFTSPEQISAAANSARLFAESRSINTFRTQLKSLVDSLFANENKYKKKFDSSIRPYLSIFVTSKNDKNTSLHVINSLIDQVKNSCKYELFILNGGKRPIAPQATKYTNIHEVISESYNQRIAIALAKAKGSHVRIFSDDDQITSNTIENYYGLASFGSQMNCNISVFHDFIINNSKGTEVVVHNFGDFQNLQDQIKYFINSKAAIPSFYSLHNIGAMKKWNNYVTTFAPPFPYSDWLLSISSFIFSKAIYKKFDGIPPIYNNENWLTPLRSENSNKNFINNHGVNSNILTIMNIFWCRDIYRLAQTNGFNDTEIIDILVADQIIRLQKQLQARLLVISKEIDSDFQKSIQRINFNNISDINDQFRKNSQLHLSIRSLCTLTFKKLENYFY